MAHIGLVLPDDLHNIPIDRTLGFAVKAEKAGLDSVWKQEASGSDAFMVLSAVAMMTEDIQLGTGVVNVFSRSPVLVGMSAVTLDQLSGGRARLGLGVSSEVLVENWHGMSFDQPLRRLRETIEIIRLVVDGGEIEYDGEIFDIGPYTAGLASENRYIPVYNAAVGEKNRHLTAEFADGWMPVMTPLSALQDLVSEIHTWATQVNRDQPLIAPWIPIAVSDNAAEAKDVARRHIAQEMAMGYNRIVRPFGYDGDEARNRWRSGDRDGAAAAITDELLNELAVFGSVDSCIDQLREYVDAGADLLILWPPFSANQDQIQSTIDALGTLSLALDC